MSLEKVKNHLKSEGIIDHLTIHETTADTVEHAAQTLGCTPAQIAKSLTFMVGEQPVMVVMAGDTRVNSSKFKAKFHQKPGMVPRDRVEELIGHAPGGVCPFAVNEGVLVYLDISMKRFDVVHAAGGADNATVAVSPEELEMHTRNSGWVDICAGWCENN